FFFLYSGFFESGGPQNKWDNGQTTPNPRQRGNLKENPKKPLNFVKNFAKLGPTFGSFSFFLHFDGFFCFFLYNGFFESGAPKTNGTTGKQLQTQDKGET